MHFWRNCTLNVSVFSVSLMKCGTKYVLRMGKNDYEKVESLVWEKADIKNGYVSTSLLKYDTEVLVWFLVLTHWTSIS